MTPIRRRRKKIERTISVPGARLRVIESGRASARAAILIHGGPGLFGYMAPLADEIGGLVRVVDYCQRGGRSSPSSGPFRIENHCRDLKSLVDRYGAERKPVLIGSSWGAVLALCYAARFPGTAEKVVLIGTGALDIRTRRRFVANIHARLSPADFARQNELQEKLKNRSLSRKTRDALDARYLATIFPAYNRNPESFRGVRMEPRPPKATAEAERDYARRMKSGRLVADLARVREPVVAFHGAHDPIPLSGVIPKLRAGLRRFKSVELADAGHVPWLEGGRAARRFAKLLRAELADQARRRDGRAAA